MILTLWAFATSRLGMVVIAMAAAVIALGVVVVKVRNDAIASANQQSTQDALDRTQDAIRRGDAIDNSPSKLRQPDHNCRDC